MKMTLFNSATETKPKSEVTVEELVGMIRKPSIRVTDTIKRMRAALAAERSAGEAGNLDKEIEYGKAASAIKKTLPAVSISGTFSKRNNSSLKAHSGMMSLDIDHMEDEELQAAKEQLRGDPHVVFFYVSPSGHGIKGGILLSTVPANDAEHKVAWGATAEYLSATYGLALDTATKDVSRLAFLSADSACYHTPDATPLDVEEWRELTPAEKEVERLQDILVKGAITSLLTPPPPCPVILQREDGTILGEAGNLVTMEGLMKCGKSGGLSAVIGAAVAPEGSGGDFLGFEVPERAGFVLHFDCEQSPRAHHQLIKNAVVKRAGLQEIPDFLKSFSFLEAEVKDRWPACQLAAETLSEQGPIRMVIFDGGADFLLLLNDEEDSRNMVAAMHRLAVKHSCLVLIVIHENPNGEGGKTRGHFGSELWRKSQACISITKGEDGISAMCGKNGILRDGEWPKSDSVYFRWSITEGMHVTVGDPSEARKQGRNAEKAEELRTLASKVFTADVMTHTGLEQAIVKAIKTTDRTARTRIKNMVEMDIIIRREDKNYERAK